MIKHKYVPWTAGKKTFQGKEDKGDVSFSSFIQSNNAFPFRWSINAEPSTDAQLAFFKELKK